MIIPIRIAKNKDNAVRYILFCVFLLIAIFQVCRAQEFNDLRRVLRTTKSENLLQLGQILEDQNLNKKEEALRLANEKGWPIKKRLENGTTYELQRINTNGIPVYYITHNATAAETISTDQVWLDGGLGLSLSGLGLTVGEWDGDAVLATHLELLGRVTQVDGATTVGDHATHVAGTMIASGVDPLALGMSNEANLNAYEWTNDDAEMSTAGANGLLLSNHSYGMVTGWLYAPDYDFLSLFFPWVWLGDVSESTTEDYNFGFYDEEAQIWDEIAHNAPYYLIVKSAGNDRGEGPAPGTTHRYIDGGSLVLSSEHRNLDGGAGGYDCISHSGLAKNVLTVGAVGDISGGYSQPSDGVMTSFSAWGPTDDGRIKPDICGNGVGLYSSFSDSIDGYGTYSGTSMAAPNVTGSLLLLQQHYHNLNPGLFMRSATLKALVIHTADEAGEAEGPDYSFGWGIMNTASAASVISEQGSTSHIKEVELSNNKTYTYSFYADGTSPLKSTLCWTDSAGTPVTPQLNPDDLMLVNDLDLRIEKGGVTYFPYTLDPGNPSNPAAKGDNFRDNVEQVYIDNPGAGIYTLTVSHKGILADEMPQDFSLVVTGTDVYTFPPTIAFFTPEQGPAGETVTITGSGFLDVTSVKFGGVEARHFFVESETEILADVGASGSTGDVEVTTLYGTGSNSGFSFSPNSINMADVIVDGSANDPDIMNTSTFVNWFPVDNAVEYEVYAHGEKITVFLSGGNFWAEINNIFFDINDDLQYALKVRAKLEDGSYTNYSYPGYSLPVKTTTSKAGFMQIYANKKGIHFVKQQPGKANISIYAVSGQLLVRDSFNGTVYTQVYPLENGVYIVEMTINGEALRETVFVRD